LTEVQELDGHQGDGPAFSRPHAQAATQVLPADSSAGTGPGSAVRQVKSVAVMPFVNMSADHDDYHFCDGLAEELLNALSNVAPVTHGLVHTATVDTARLPLSLLDEVSEERGSFRKRRTVYVAVQALVHSEHELGHTSALGFRLHESVRQ